MIDVTIVSGFLGAGKTTWLSQTLKNQNPGIGTIALVVNDFASEGVDDLLLKSSRDDGGEVEISAITGGCICCDKREELAASLVAFAASRHKSGQGGIEQVFIETSGVADPASIVELITSHPVLQANLQLSELVVILDSLNGAAQLRHQSLARSQVSAADRIVISKADLADHSSVAALAALALRLNPHASLTSAAGGTESELPMLPDYSAGDLTDPIHWQKGEDFKPDATVVKLSPTISWAEYALWLEAATRARPHQFLRSKGVIQTPNGPIVLQSVGQVIAQPRPAPEDLDADEPGPTAMIFITQGIEAGALDKSLAAFVPSA
jgi:G3E family GTPase